MRIHEELSAEQVQEPLPDTVALLVSRMGDEVCSVRELMQRCGLKHRPSFLLNYLQPAMGLGLVRMLHPEQPRHPRQKYMLSVRGLLLKKTAARIEMRKLMLRGRISADNDILGCADSF